MSNPFDAFDEPAAAPAGNPFDAFDPPVAASPAPTLGDRFMLNMDDGYRSGTAGATRNFLASPTAEPVLDATVGGVSPRDVLRVMPPSLGLGPLIPQQSAPGEYEAARAARVAADQAMPSWMDAPTIPQKIVQGGAALAGQLVGGMGNPENMIGPLAGGVRRAGQGALSHIAGLFGRGAVTQAPAAAGGNAIAQGLDMAAGDREDYSPEETGLAFALGGALGGGLNVAPTVARAAIGRIREYRAARGATPEQVAAPIRPEEALATFGNDDVAALAQANGITDPADPRLVRLTELLGARRAAEADPLVAAQQRAETAPAPPPGQAPVTPAQQLNQVLPGVEDQVAGEAASGMRFQQPGAQEAEIAARTRSILPALNQPEPPPPVIALPGENGRVRGQIIEPGAANSPREVTVPVRGTGEPGVQAGAELRTGQGTALVPTEPPLPRPMPDDAVTRARAQNDGGTLPDAARLSRVAQQVDADVAAGRVPRRQRDAEMLARMGAQETPVMRQGPIDLADGRALPVANERPTPPQTNAGQNRAGIAEREAGRPSGNDRPPGWTDPPPAATPPRPPEPPQGGATTDSRLAPWQAALDRVTKRRGELQAEYDALVEGANVRRKGGEAQGSARAYAKPQALDRAIAAKGAEIDKLNGRAAAFQRAIQDVNEGRTPPARLEYPNLEDNKPAVPGVPKEPPAVLARIRALGGLRDDGGDFASLQIPGVVNSNSRLSFQDMADQLASEGYFPELRAQQDGPNPVTLNSKDLLREAITDGQGGTKRYTADDGAAYKEAQDTRDVALEQTAEVAEHLGISHAEARGLSRGQLADFLAEKRSIDEMDALVRELDEAHAADHADFEARMAEQESRDSYEPPPRDTERDNSRPITQQEAENVPPPTERPSGDGEAGRQGAGRPEGERGAEGRGGEAQGNLDRLAGGEDGAGAPRPGGAERGGGQGARGQDAQPELIANDKPATQAQAARDARGNKGKVPQAGVESFPLFDPEAAKQGKLPDVTAEQVAKNINGKLYSGLAIFDPEAWKVLFGPVAKAVIKPFAESWREFDIAAGTSRQAARDIDARVPRGAGPIETKLDAAAPDVTRWARASAAAVRTALYSDGIAMRAYADGLPAGSKAALHEFLDGWHANAGRAGSGKGATYDEGVGRRFTTAINDLQAGLGDILKSPAEMDQVVKLVQNPGSIRPGSKIHDAAAKLKDWLGEHLKYMRESGVDVGEIKRGYFPRRLDMDAAWKDQAGFVAAAERAYRASGLSAIEARDAAARWMDNIRHNGADKDSPVGAHGAPGLSADHVSERVLPKSADEHMAKFLQHDPKQVLIAYAHTAARRAELTRVLGKDNAEWKKLAAAFKGDGAEGALARVGDFVRTQTGHVEGQGLSPRVQNALGWVRLWGTMGLLSKATITSLTEVFSAGARSGNMLDSWQMVKTMAAYHMGRESGERLRLLAEDVGTMTNHLAGGMAAARWTGGQATSAKQAAVAEKYFRAIVLEQWTHGMNVGATGVGDTFLRAAARDLGADGRAGRQAGFALAELGISREKHAAFAAWVKGNAGDGMTVQALASAPKEIAEQYRSALYRFTRQVSVQPSAVARPRWANSPLGSLAFHLSAYAYAVHDNVLLRAKRVYQNGDLTTGDKLMMSGKMAASLMLAIPAQMAIGEARSAIFDSKKSAEAAKENRVSNAVSRAGVLGAVDPWMQVFAGLRYQKDIATSMTGPTIGRILGAVEVGANTMRGTVNPFGPSRDRTDTEKRKVAGALYDVGLAPGVNYLASRLPLPVAAAIVQGMGASRTREGFLSAVGAPPPRNNRRRRE